MLNRGNLGTKKSIGVKFKEHSGLKVIGIFIILLTLQKESPKQSLSKVSSEAAVHICSSEQVFIEIS